MSTPRHWLTISSDPLPQLIADHPKFANKDHLIAFSQTTALIHWPTIEAYEGKVSIILRRVGREGEAEWRDHLLLLRQLLKQSGKRAHLLALNEGAATSLSGETGQTVTTIPELQRKFRGDRSLTLSRAKGPLQILRNHSDPLPARQYNLARLRRVAVMETDAMDADLSDVVELANGVPQVDRPRSIQAPVVFVVVPNGIGLGHVTRMLAVAQRLRAQRGARVIFWSFSRATGIISQFGFEAVSRQTAGHIGAEADAWRKWETAEFASVISELRPDLVVQDSAALEEFVVDALAGPNVGAARLALIRRGMWQKHILGTNPLASEDLADLVIEPGDLASPADQGITRGRATKTIRFARIEVSAPVTLTRPAEMLDRKRARKALGLGRGRHCLISLGGDAFSDWSHLVRHLIDAAEKARVRLVWARSPLATPDLDNGANPQILTRSFYPLAPYFAAFDGVVSSVGYNSFHELMQLYDRPVLLAPRQHSALDDQAARARFAASQGWAMHVEPVPYEYSSISLFMDDVRAAKKVTSRPQWRDGAAEISSILIDLIEAGVS